MFEDRDFGFVFAISLFLLLTLFYLLVLIIFIRTRYFSPNWLIEHSYGPYISSFNQVRYLQISDRPSFQKLMEK